MSLSDEIIDAQERAVIRVKDVKEFIKELLEHFKAPKGKFGSSINEFIKAKAGDKLI